VNALQTRGLCKSFGRLVVADDVSIAVPQGARHALIGPNGAGKTTLINMVTGLLAPDAGSVSLGGTDITGMKSHARVKAGLGRTFQINTLFPALTPLEAVTLAVLERRGATRRFFGRLSAQTQAIDEAADILRRIRLADRSTRPTRDLAYGEQRLLEIALALATRPKVLLLDEPAAGVPRSESAALFEVIRGLPDEMSVLFIEHDMDLVFPFASHIHVLVQGRVLTSGPPDEISTDPRVREVYLGSAHD
jgi:ABC-type branched-subunit amino acid transport system ATPase component